MWWWLKRTKGLCINWQGRKWIKREVLRDEHSFLQLWITFLSLSSNEASSLHFWYTILYFSWVITGMEVVHHSFPLHVLRQWMRKTICTITEFKQEKGFLTFPFFPDRFSRLVKSVGSTRKSSRQWWNWTFGHFQPFSICLSHLIYGITNCLWLCQLSYSLKCYCWSDLDTQNSQVTVTRYIWWGKLDSLLKMIHFDQYYLSVSLYRRVFHLIGREHTLNILWKGSS